MYLNTFNDEKCFGSKLIRVSDGIKLLHLPPLLSTNIQIWSKIKCIRVTNYLICKSTLKPIRAYWYSYLPLQTMLFLREYNDKTNFNGLRTIVDIHDTWLITYLISGFYFEIVWIFSLFINHYMYWYSY